MDWSTMLATPMWVYLLTSLVAVGWGGWLPSLKFNGFRAAYFWIGSVVGTTLVLILVLFAQIANCSASQLIATEATVVLKSGSCNDNGRTTWAWYLLVRDAQEGIGIAFTFFGVVWVALVGYATRYGGGSNSVGDLSEKIDTLSQEIRSVTNEDLRVQLLKEQVQLLRDMSSKNNAT